METPRSQSKVAMNYGGMYGLSGTVVYLLFYFMGADIENKWTQWIGYALMITFIVIGIKNYRDQDLGGFISYGKSLGTGILISVFGGIITGAFTVLLFTVIAPDMAQRIMDKAQEDMAERGMSEDQMATAMEWTSKMMNPGVLFIFSIIGSAFMGLIFSLIISIFMKKEENPFGSNVS